MVNKINSACCRISDLPSRRQWTKLFTIDVAKIPVKTNIKWKIPQHLASEPNKCKCNRTIPWSLRKCIVSETWSVQLESLLPRCSPPKKKHTPQNTCCKEKISYQIAFFHTDQLQTLNSYRLKTKIQATATFAKMELQFYTNSDRKRF